LDWGRFWACWRGENKQRARTRERSEARLVKMEGGGERVRSRRERH